MDYSRGERAMMPALSRWLVGTGRLRGQTLVAHELPWQGRRVDLALLTQRGVSTAFELKVGSLQRVLEQAIYNSSSFNRSWMVVPNRPKAEGLQWARRHGVGVLLITAGSAEALVAPAMKLHEDATSRRLRRAIRSRGLS